MDKQVEVEPWERQPKETAKAYEAFCVYRDMVQRSYSKVAEKLQKSETIIGRWGRTYDWRKRAAAWDEELDRIGRLEQIEQIKKTRRLQFEQAREMRERGMKYLEAIPIGRPGLVGVVSLLKLAMEQERICMGDVGEVIEERDGGKAESPVTFYIPSNGRNDTNGDANNE